MSKFHVLIKSWRGHFNIWVNENFILKIDHVVLNLKSIFYNILKENRIKLACLISENLAIRSSGIDQLKISKFSFSLDSVEVFGSTLWPVWMPHRRATWAGVFPSFSATLLRTGFLSTSSLLRNSCVPNGENPLKGISLYL